MRAANPSLFAMLGAILLAVNSSFVMPAAAQSQSQAQAGTSAGASPAGQAPGTFHGAMPTTYPDWFKQSFLELGADVEEAADEGRRVMVVFHQDGCPYCNALVEKNLSQKDIETQVRKHFDVIEMNIWGDRPVAHVGGQEYTEKTFSRALKVQYTPTLLFFDEQGRIVLRLNGYIPPTRFKLALDYVSGRHESTTSFRAFAKAKTPASTRKAMFAQEFFAPGPHDLLGALGQGRPLAVFFEQTDCPQCAVLHQDVLVQPESQALAREFHAVQLDMWSNTELVLPDGTRSTPREWAKTLDVNYAPTIVLFDENGKEVIRAESALKRFHTQSILDYVASGAFRNESNFQRYISERAEHFIEQGIDVDIWK